MRSFYSKYILVKLSLEHGKLLSMMKSQDLKVNSLISLA